jgi:hypothetical protein
MSIAVSSSPVDALILFLRGIIIMSFNLRFFRCCVEFCFLSEIGAAFSSVS